MKSFLTPATGKIVEYPDHFADLKPEIVEVEGNGAVGGFSVLTPGDPVIGGFLGTLENIEIIGGVVLVDPSTDLSYSATSLNRTTQTAWKVGVMGGMVLLDPDTGLPYRFDIV